MYPNSRARNDTMAYLNNDFQFRNDVLQKVLFVHVVDVVVFDIMQHSMTLKYIEPALQYP